MGGFAVLMDCYLNDVEPNSNLLINTILMICGIIILILEVFLNSSLIFYMIFPIVFIFFGLIGTKFFLLAYFSCKCSYLLNFKIK